MQISGSPGQPSPEDLERRRRAAQRLHAQERIIPVCWPATVLLARTDEHAVALRAVWVFTDGVRFDIRARQDDRRMHSAFGMHGLAMGGQQAVANLFRFGVRLSDGRSAANFENIDEIPGLPSAAVGDELRLSARPGGGSGTRVDASYHLNALPPDGELALVVAWPAVDLPETTTVLDVTGMAEAAAGVIDPWPGEVPEMNTRRRPPRIAFGERAPGAFFQPIIGVDEGDVG